VAQSTLRRPGETQAPGDLKEANSVEKPKKRRISGDRAALGVTKKEIKVLRSKGLERRADNLPEPGGNFFELQSRDRHN